MSDNTMLERDILFRFLVQDLVSTSDMTKQEAEQFVKKSLEGALQSEN